MADMQLMVPEKIKVGFDKRPDTYNGNLAYVIYYDQKGVLRKETSWEGWRDKTIPPIDLDNVPTSGFVLNKGVGGARQSYGWNARNEYIRIFDPRGFEFEISLPNLLFILNECNCNKGKGLEGEFVYAWQGNSLILLPVKTSDYKNSMEFTKLKTCSVKVKELALGGVYLTKSQETLIYLGKLNYHYIIKARYGSDARSHADPSGVKQRYVFVDESGQFIFFDDVKKLAVCKSKTAVPNFAELVDEYQKSKFGSRVVELYLKDLPATVDQTDPSYRYYDYFYNKIGNAYTCYRYHDNHVYETAEYALKDGVLSLSHRNKRARNPAVPKQTSIHGYRNEDYDRDTMKWVEPTTMRLIAKLESGSEFRIGHDRYSHEHINFHEPFTDEPTEASQVEAYLAAIKRTE